MGPFANINRAVQVLASQELEGFDVGCAGIIGNLINILDIPCNAIYAYLFFSEVMEPLEYAGGAIICFAILITTASKAKRHIDGEKVVDEQSMKEISPTGNEISDHDDDHVIDEIEALMPQSRSVLDSRG